MARTTCKDCKGPREADSTYGSYCMDCGRKRQRDRYARIRSEAGHEVISRVDQAANDDRRRQRLLSLNGRPGACEVCQEHTAELILINVGDRAEQEEDLLAGEIRALWCTPCREISKLLADNTLVRAHTMYLYLQREQLTLAKVLPDPNDVMHQRVPTPLSIAATATATSEQTDPQ
jgi:hypothetical protein